MNNIITYTLCKSVRRHPDSEIRTPIHNLVLAHLFVKVTRPGKSEATLSVIEPSCHLLLPVWPRASAEKFPWGPTKNKTE